MGGLFGLRVVIAQGSRPIAPIRAARRRPNLPPCIRWLLLPVASLSGPATYFSLSIKAFVLSLCTWSPAAASRDGKSAFLSASGSLAHPPSAESSQLYRAFSSVVVATRPIAILVSRGSSKLDRNSVA